MLINGNPHWKNVQQLAIYFQLINLATNKKAYVDMGNPRCNLEDNLCGTPACHAGWFGVFKDDLSTSFSSYSSQIAVLLGFEFVWELEAWAGRKPELWGNEGGYGIFSDGCAFGNYEDDEVTLKIISNHWWKVAKRLYRLQKGVA